MEVFIKHRIEFPIHNNVQERISTLRFSPLFLNKIAYCSLLNLFSYSNQYYGTI